MYMFGITRVYSSCTWGLPYVVSVLDNYNTN